MSYFPSWLYNSVRRFPDRTYRPCQRVARVMLTNIPLHSKSASNSGSSLTVQQVTHLNPTTSPQNSLLKALNGTSNQSIKRSAEPFDPVEALDKAGLIAKPTELAHILAELPHSFSLYIDLEGHQLSRHGTLDIISILVWPPGKVYLIDVYSLGEDAFTTPANNTVNKQSADLKGRTTLKEVLENTTIQKYFWDVRSDADALWALFGINIRGVTDLQLLENAARDGDRSNLRSLGQSISQDTKLSSVARSQWHGVKDHGRRMMHPRPDLMGKPIVKAVMLGDNLLTTKIPKVMRTAALRAHQLRDIEVAHESRGYRITENPEVATLDNSHFRQRPIDVETMAYCANDVVHLPALHRHYVEKLGHKSPWHERVRLESNARVDEAQTRNFRAGTPDKRFSPWSDMTTCQDEWLDVFEIDADKAEGVENE